MIGKTPQGGSNMADSKKLPREMTGAELKSMLKSSINFKSLGGVKCPELTLPPEKKQWWRYAKVGMFVHWGLYSILGRGEWVRHNEHIPEEEYARLADQFTGDECNMDEWTQLAADMGAKYMVMVARHHDGFALWDSPGSYQGFTTANTASHRDFVREYTEACRRKGLRVGIYYSNMDWRFPGYFDPKGLPESAQAMKKQAYDQIGELCGNYGKIDILWYDGSWLNHSGSDTTAAWLWEPVELNKLARKYNPDLLINPRSGWEGDFYCDEGSHEISGKIIPVPWEKNMCVCSGASWGWMADDPVSDLNWLIHMLVDVVTRDGNILLNVAPDGHGAIPAAVQERLRELGQWLKEHGDSIYGTRGGPVEPVDQVYGTTYREDTVYLHVQNLEKFAQSCVPLTNYQILSCRYGNQELNYAQDSEGLHIDLPADLPQEADTILTLKTDRPVEGHKDQEIYFTGR